MHVCGGETKICAKIFSEKLLANLKARTELLVGWAPTCKSGDENSQESALLVGVPKEGSGKGVWVKEEATSALQPASLWRVTTWAPS